MYSPYNRMNTYNILIWDTKMNVLAMHITLIANSLPWFNNATNKKSSHVSSCHQVEEQSDASFRHVKHMHMFGLMSNFCMW